MVDDTSNSYSKAKENELNLFESFNKLKHENSLLYKDNTETKLELNDQRSKNKELMFEVERLSQETERLQKLMSLAERERDVFKRRVEEIESNAAEVDYIKQEVSSLQNVNSKLKKSAEGLIDEVCRFKLENKQLKSKNEYLEEIAAMFKKNDDKLKIEILKLRENSLAEGYAKYSKQSDKDQGSKDYNYNSSKNFHAESYKRQLSSFDQPNKYSNVVDQYSAETKKDTYTHGDKYRDADTFIHGDRAAGTDLKSLRSNNPYLHDDNIAPPKISNNFFNDEGSTPNYEPYKRAEQHTNFDWKNEDYKRVAGAGNNEKDQFDPITNLPKNQRAPLDIMSFPAHKNIEMNKNQIDDLNHMLSEYQDKKKIVEAELCKLPSRPKKLSVN